jgi:hypothetical protein
MKVQSTFAVRADSRVALLAAARPSATVVHRVSNEFAFDHRAELGCLGKVVESNAGNRGAIGVVNGELLSRLLMEDESVGMVTYPTAVSDVVVFEAFHSVVTPPELFKFFTGHITGSLRLKKARAQLRIMAWKESASNQCPASALAIRTCLL